MIPKLPHGPALPKDNSRVGKAPKNSGDQVYGTETMSKEGCILMH